MHNTFFRTLLIALIVTFPTFSAAADGDSVIEPKAAAPSKLSVGAPQLIATENKQVETNTAPPSAKIGYVDIGRIGTESERGKALKALLTSKKNQLQGKIDGKKKQIEKLKTSIEAKIETMTPQQREAKSREFQKKLEDFQKFAQSSEQELFKLQEKETTTLFEEIEKSAIAHGKDNGFSVIVIKKELLYVGNAVDAQDVTDALIKSMNETVLKK